MAVWHEIICLRMSGGMSSVGKKMGGRGWVWVGRKGGRGERDGGRKNEPLVVFASTRALTEEVRPSMASSAVRLSSRSLRKQKGKSSAKSVSNEVEKMRNEPLRAEVSNLGSSLSIPPGSHLFPTETKAWIHELVSFEEGSNEDETRTRTHRLVPLRNLGHLLCSTPSLEVSLSILNVHIERKLLRSLSAVKIVEVEFGESILKTKEDASRSVRRAEKEDKDARERTYLISTAGSIRTKSFSGRFVR